MAKVFLSHSSRDKGVVKRAAADLLNRGIPVWLDAWEMSPGDVLLREIEKAIANNDLYLVFLSRSALESGWVQDELDLAFAKEKEIGRKFVIPLLLEDVPIPSPLKQKLFLRVHDSYTAAIEAIDRLAREMRISESASPFDELRLPILIYEGRYVDRAQLEARLAAIAKFRGDNQFTPSQLLFADDQQYEDMRRKCLGLMDALPQRGLPAHAKAKVNEFYRQMTHVDRILPECVATIVNRDAGPYGTLDIAEIAYWTVAYCRTRQLHWASQLIASFDEPLDPAFAVPYVSLVGQGVAEFYGVREVGVVVVFRQGGKESVTFWVDREDVTYEDLWSVAGLPQPLEYKWIGDFINKYAVPQMLIRHYLGDDRAAPVIWSPEGWQAGIP